MKTRIFLFIMIFPVAIQAQFLGFSLKSDCSQLVENALSGSAVILQQKYLLNDTVNNKQFGVNNQNYFGDISVPALRIEGGLLLPTQALMPWNDDQNFEPHRDRYVPEICESNMFFLKKQTTQMQKLPNPIIKENATAITANLSCFKDDSQLFETGLQCDTTTGEKDGWLVWVAAENGVMSVDSLHYIVAKKKILANADSAGVALDKPQPENVVAGFYVVPTISQLGQVTFLLSGVVDIENDVYTLQFPFLSDNDNVSVELTSIVAEPDTIRAEPQKIVVSPDKKSHKKKKSK